MMDSPWNQERSRRKAMFDARPRGFTPQQVAALKSRYSPLEWKALTQRERMGLDPVLSSGLNKETP